MIRTAAYAAKSHSSTTQYRQLRIRRPCHAKVDHANPSALFVVNQAYLSPVGDAPVTHARPKNFESNNEG